MTFRTSIPIRFGHEDHAQIVYFPRFFDFFHQVFEDFFNDNGTPYHKVLGEDRVGWPAVHAEADFHAPIRFGDVLAVALDVERIGRKSANFRYVGTREDETKVVTGRVICACVNLDTFEPQPIPEKYRSLFEDHQLA